MKLERAREMMDGIDRLSTGEKAALKRSLGRTLDTASSGARMAFYRAFPGASRGEEMPCFLCACGACAMERLGGSERSFVAALKKLAAQEYQEGTRSKLRALLDTPGESEFEALFAAKVGRLIQYMKAKGVKVDFAALLRDLCAWDLPDRPVQRKWARAFFADLREPKDEEGKQDAD